MFMKKGRSIAVDSAMIFLFLYTYWGENGQRKNRQMPVFIL